MTDIEAMQAIERRLDTYERNASDLAGTMTRTIERTAAVEKRVVSLEETRQNEQVRNAGHVEREKALLSDVASMKADIASIKGTFARALWVFISAILLAFATFLINGGLAT